MRFSGFGYLPGNGPDARGSIATLSDIPEGNDGAIVTLKAMREMARGGVRSDTQMVRTTALSLIRDLPERAWYAEIQRLHNFVQTQIRYVYDPTEVELVQTPDETLAQMQGDCDDQSTLLASLLDSIGHPARFVAVGFGRQSFSHVLVQTRVGNFGDDSATSKDWLTCETIIDKPLGWFPPAVTSYYVCKV